MSYYDYFCAMFLSGKPRAVTALLRYAAYMREGVETQNLGTAQSIR